MKYIEVDEELYRYIASKTERIGESASDILRRLLGLTVEQAPVEVPEDISHPGRQVNVSVEEPLQSTQTVVFTELVNEAQLEAQKGAVGRFLFILESLYLATGRQFDKVLQVQGRGRLYFATSKDELLQASQSANPKEIGSSGFWVTTNNNTAKKRTILTEVLQQFGATATEAAQLAQRL
ncbi:MAG: replication initiation negative regulator SeqA [Shewanella sp.]|nr:replication initiation negative regulator SeqA [Shewanella sp.]MCF1430206.1 replication initiation negative regulator SeqA [Shewanella sp.]MCF1438061.1 replication initiation negative regulator SeqA [Shewanella sp.]MCF1459242.1 replication initiation negative regulator SeqA [Shewanella sp.]